jgi:glutathionylspermidine synthase
MITPRTIKGVTPELMEEVGFNWHTDSDGSAYIANEVIDVTQSEAEAFYEAGNTLYEMFVEAGEHVIENDLLFDIGIPFNIAQLIKQSWENDIHWHLYGRFDLSGGIDGAPIKLIEFNADTPTGVFETAVVQWATLKANGMDEDAQYNNFYEGMIENFKRLIMLEGDTDEFENHYDGWKILFSSIKDGSEEENTVKFLQNCANDAGFETGFCYLEDVKFDEDEGVFDAKGNYYEYWFKLYPWEDIAFEDELPSILNNIMENQKAIILNPAYTLMFQSKGFMKILSDLFPDSPYLLKTSFEPLEGIKQVKKQFFGREGANTQIIAASGEILEETTGEYENYKSVYQEYVELPKNAQKEKYQAGLFFAYEPIALGFRKGGEILDNYAKFVSHKII